MIHRGCKEINPVDSCFTIEMPKSKQTRKGLVDMENNMLKNQILKVLENQIKMKQPKCVNITLKRLVSEGCSEKDAKEMIAAILLEEIYHISKAGQVFDEKQYETKLNRLGREKANESETNKFGMQEFSVEELIDQIAFNTGHFPKVILVELINRKSEITSLSLDILTKVRNKPLEYRDKNNYFAHIYASYLLSQFRVKEAYPIFIDIMSLPDDLPYDLFGDTILETGSRMLASVCGSDLKLIKKLITNENADVYMRSQAIESLVILALNCIVERDVVISYFSKLIANPSIRNNSLLLSIFINSCCYIHADELYEEIKKCYIEQLVDESFIDIEDVNKVMNREKNDVLEESRDNSHLKFIEDTISELEWWSCFDEDYRERMNQRKKFNGAQIAIKSTKIGRNDACSCGSGKKYKKCCGR